VPNPEIEIRMKDANESGVIESFILETNLVADVIYIVIQTINGNHKSELSNIPSVQVEDMFTGPPTVSTEIPSTVSADPPSTVPPVDPTTTEGPGTGTPGTPEPSTDEDEPFFETTWGIVVIVAIALVVLLTGAGIFYYCYRVRGCYHTEKENARASRVGSPERPDSYADADRP